MKELDPAVRQYRHNTGEGFVVAYDHTETRKIVGTLIHQRVDLELKVLDLESEIESRDKRTDVQYHRSDAIRELLELCDEEIAQTPDGEEFGIEHLARAVNKLKRVGEIMTNKQEQTSRKAFDRKDVSVESWTSAKVSGFSLRAPNGIKVKHYPTQIEVTCEDERSQHRNRDVALKELERLVNLHNDSRRTGTYVFKDGELKPSDSMTKCHEYLRENPDASPEQIWRAATQYADR